MKFKALLQAVAIVALSSAAAGLTWHFQGGPDRSVACAAELLKEGEICLADVPSEGVIWVDARSRKQFEQDAVPGALLLTDDRHENWDALLVEVVPQLFDAKIVVIYCNTEACGSSEAVAKKLRELDLGPEIRVLYGGWKAFVASGKVTSAKKKN